MRIVIIGGGVVGVTTAYQLQRDGHEVVIVEREPALAEGASHGNAGMIAPGHSFVWSSPAAPGILLKSLVLPDQALRFRPSADPRLWSWSWAFLRECTAAKARRNTLLKHRLAVHSQAVLQEVAAAEGIAYDRTARGILYLHRSPAALEAGLANMRLLEEDGQEIRLLDRDGVVALNPALAGAEGIAGAIYCPTDESGDCAAFTRALAGHVTARGGQFLTGATVEGFETEGDTITGLRARGADPAALRADAYVLCAGTWSGELGRGLGLRLPIYPIKGYSLTIPITDPESAPRLPAVDEHNLVALTPMGTRLRVTATAEFAGYDRSHRPSDFTFMRKVTKSLYPDGLDHENPVMWAGLRPMTPDNLPIFGRRRHRNLWLNTGHGHIGWTMSHGSARITADLIAGRSPEIAMDGLLAA